MEKSLRPCLQPGCTALVRSGYCEEHKPKIKEIIKGYILKGFRKLDEKKTPEEIKFYSSGAWIKTSKLYRIKHPLCERCVTRGYYVKAELVHHVKELRDIWRDKGNPLSWKYLQSLCRNCHMEDLRAKKRLCHGDNNKKYKY